MVPAADQSRGFTGIVPLVELLDREADRKRVDGLAGFLLFNSRFPRSVRACVHDISNRLTQLRSSHHLIGGAGDDQLDGWDGNDLLEGRLAVIAEIKRRSPSAGAGCSGTPTGTPASSIRPSSTR